MTWSTPLTFVAGNVLTASQLNSNIRDNINQTAPAIVTTAGDLVYATGANALARLGIGTAYQVLRINSGVTAPEWATPLGFKISSQSPNGAQIDFTSIPATPYKHLRIELYAASNIASFSDVGKLQFNGDTGSNYDSETFTANGTSTSASELLGASYINMPAFPGSSAPANTFNSATLIIENYANTSNNKCVHIQASFKQGTTTGQIYVYNIVGFWRSNSAINEVKIFCNVSSFVSGTIASLYGLM